MLFIYTPIQQNLWVGIAVWAICLTGGYSLAAARVLGHQDRPNLPEITRSKGDPGSGHTAIVYFTHGEPETYNPIGWLNQFREFDEQRIAFVPFLARPFFIYQLRKKYLRVGMSKHRQNHQQMVRRLEETLRQEGDQTSRVYLCFLDDSPRPDEAVIRAVNEGASRVIVAEVFVSISNHTLEGKNLIDDLHMEQWGIPVLYTGPLWNSQTLHKMFLERANTSLDFSEKANTGVLLVGHGQPDEWDRLFKTETEHEIAFRESILELFVRDGYKRDLLGLAWMEFKNPKPAKIIELFVAKGARKILYYSAAISADSIHSQYDVPDLVAKAHIPNDIQVTNLGGWNDDPLVIRAIWEKIEHLMKEKPV